MKVRETGLLGVLIVEPDVYGDKRGFFLETHHDERYAKLGIGGEGFVQDNLSFSRRGVLRGLHFQNPNPQGKLVYVLEGEVYDVAADIRVGSPTFGRSVGETLSSDNKFQLYVPPGYAHGFLVLSETALFAYKCTEYYHPEAEMSVAWNDPKLAIKWPISEPALSEKDKRAPFLTEIDQGRLPVFVDPPKGT